MPARKARRKAPRKTAAPRRRAAAPVKARPARRAASKTAPPRRPGKVDPVIVGLGASAGGLTALEQFFANAPAGLGAAYVVVQHLDPEHASALVQLLQRVSRLPVVEVTDGMTAKADTVHVIPPNREMEVFDGTLLLTVPSAPPGRRLAIDGFLRSLADERGPQAVGVILSGSGSDGALGMAAIQQAGGLCLVQDPASAKFDPMPTAALRAVPESLVASAERLPGLLAVTLKGPSRGAGGASTSRPTVAGLSRVLSVLRSATGRDFSKYKRSSVARRVERRMAANGITDVEVYARHLREHPAEAKVLFQELLINVTAFFRDPEAFEALAQGFFAEALRAKASGDTVRVWVAGCASGEEAYSLAIVLRELLDEGHPGVKLQIYGTDLDEDAIAHARAGLYPASIGQAVSAARLERFFTPEEAGYRVRKELRQQVVFAVQDLVADPPFTHIDLLSCRNVFIYLEPELQDRLLALFHYALRPGGALLLSPAEGVGAHSDLFATVDRKWRIFRAQRTAASARAVLASGLSWVRSPLAGEVPRATEPGGAAELTRRLLLQQYAPASVLVDAAGTILYVHGETGRFLRPAPGQPTLSLVEMACDGLQAELRAALQAAAAKGRTVHRPGVVLEGVSAPRSLDLTVRPVGPAKAGAGLLLVSFAEAAAPAAPPSRGRGKAGRGGPRTQELLHALAATRERLQTTIEEQQTSHEELQSTNEELQSTNEEVQASNEELETAKEELQSVNEELSTVNAELQSRVEQLTETQDDLKNLFEAISVGTVFLDERLRVRRFTREALRIYRLASADVGRPLSDIKSNLVDQDLLTEAQRVLDTLVPIDREVRTTDGATFAARLLPYRTSGNAIRGVVLTFMDTSPRPVVPG